MRNLTLRDPSFLGASLLSVSNSPLLNIPFSVNRTLTDTVSGGSLITFSRAAATGTFIDSSGVLQTAAADAARFTTDPLTLVSLGLLGEEARINSIRNNTVVGAVAGTPGTIPSNWSYIVVGSGLARQIIGTGKENGIDYIDVRISGTATSTVVVTIGIDRGAAATGQTWTESAYLKLAAGSTANITSWNLLITEETSSNAFIAGADYPVATPTSTLARVSATRTLSGGATVALVFGQIRIFCTNGAAIDFTLRIGLPQLEQGSSATSPILTTSTAVTRNADVADITSANSALIGAIRTLFIEFRSPAVGTRGVISLNDGTANNRIEVRTSGTAVQVLIVTGGTTVTIAAGTIVANARARLAVRIGDASSAASLNGAAPVTATATRPTVDRAAIARTQANEYLNGTIATISAWGQEFTDSMLVIQSLIP